MSVHVCVVVILDWQLLFVRVYSGQARAGEVPASPPEGCSCQDAVHLQ